MFSIIPEFGWAGEQAVDQENAYAVVLVVMRIEKKGVWVGSGGFVFIDVIISGFVIGVMLPA